MHASPAFPIRDDGHLWRTALWLSLLAHLLLFAFAGLAIIDMGGRIETAAATPAQREESVAVIYAEPAGEEDAASEAARRRFARTSPDQAAEPAENPDFIGERNTRATSDLPPVPDAPPLPSQAGITPRDESDIETTESDYQDGELIPDVAAQTVPETAPPPAPPVEEAPPGESSLAAATPPRERLYEGPDPVDLPVPPETTPADEIKPAPEQAAAAESQPPAPAEEALDGPPAPAAEASPRPAFRGHQRRTAIVGSISRTGRSALNVEDSALGRYQAAISRAVELEWQRNCVRHRDFITPGFLTVRFFVENSGRVRSVQFVGDMETGEIQKGFTLNSIRDAAIPPMPSALRGEFEDDPLELIFRFYF